MTGEVLRGNDQALRGEEETLNGEREALKCGVNVMLLWKPGAILNTCKLNQISHF